MIDPNIPAKMLLQPADDLRGQCNLRQQVKHLLTTADDLFYMPDIDLRFAARGHPMQETDGLLPEHVIHRPERKLLRRRELEIDADVAGQVSDAVDSALFQLQNALIHQPLELRI